MFGSGGEKLDGRVWGSARAWWTGGCGATESGNCATLRCESSGWSWRSSWSANGWASRANDEALDPFCAAAGAESEVDATKRYEQSTPVTCGSGFGAGRLRLLFQQQDPSEHEACIHIAGRHQAEVSYLGEALRQNVFEEASDERLGRHCGRTIVSRGDRDGAAIVVGDTVVGDRNSVSVSAEIGEDLLGASEGSFTVDDPVFPEELGEQSVEGRDGLEPGREFQLSFLVGSLDGVDELSAEELSEHFDGKQIVFPGCSPTFTVESEPTSSNDTVKMWMEAKVVGPGVEDCGHAQDGAQPLGISAQDQQGSGSCSEEQSVQCSAVPSDQLSQLARQSEYDVEVVRRQDALLSLGQPTRLGQGLALRAVPISTGVVGRLREVTAWAHVDVSTENGSATSLDGRHRQALFRPQRVLFSEDVPVCPKDVGHLISWRRESFGPLARMPRHVSLAEHFALLRAQ